MTQEEFIEILDEKGYPYVIEGDKVIVNGEGDFYWELKTFPSGVEFRNEGNVDLKLLTTLHSDVEFNNDGNVLLYHLEKIHPSIRFNNSGYVSLILLITSTIVWEGNIEGIGSKGLLNTMIKRGMFI